MPKVSSSDLTQRRKDILEGARRCFAEHGYEGATVRRLEEATGKSSWRKSSIILPIRKTFSSR